MSALLDYVYLLYLNVYKYLWKYSSCIFCNLKYGSGICEDCEPLLCERHVRHQQMCQTCGIRLSSEKILCVGCRDKISDSQHAFVYSVWSYNIFTQTLIHNYKKQGNKVISYYLGLTIYKFLESHIDSFRDYVYIYMPANPQHIRRVGFDYMKLFANSLRIQAQIKFMVPLFYRKKSIEQKKLGKIDRRENIASSLRINEKTVKKILNTRINAFKIILLDDIVTTGASVEQARKLLRTHPLCIDRLESLVIISAIKTEY